MNNKGLFTSGKRKRLRADAEKKALALIDQHKSVATAWQLPSPRSLVLPVIMALQRANSAPTQSPAVKEKTRGDVIDDLKKMLDQFRNESIPKLADAADQFVDRSIPKFKELSNQLINDDIPKLIDSSLLKLKDAANQVIDDSTNKLLQLPKKMYEEPYVKPVVWGLLGICAACYVMFRITPAVSNLVLNCKRSNKVKEIASGIKELIERLGTFTNQAQTSTQPIRTHHKPRN